MDGDRSTDPDSAPRGDRLRCAVAAMVAALLAVVVYHGALNLWFTGIDALPLVLSNRLDALVDAPKLLVHQYLEVYRHGAIAGSAGIRPIGSASIALDYALWGLDPRGHHLTSVLIHALNTALVLVFVREVRPARWLGLGMVASLAFALHPVAAATVPLMGARYDLLLCTFTLLTLITLLRYTSAPTRRRLIGVVTFGGLALLSKETGVILLPIVALTAGWAWRRWGLDVRRAVSLVAGFGVLVVVFVVYRSWVLHGVGGYPLHPGDPLHGVLIMSQWFFVSLLRPYPLATATTSWYGAAGVAAGCFGGLFAAITVAAAWSRATRRPTRAVRPGTGSPVADDDRAVLLALWLLPVFGFYVFAFVVTGVFKELYLYSVLGIWSTLFGFAVVAVYERLKTHAGSPRGAGLALTLPSLAAAVLAILAFSWARHSPLGDSLLVWRRASDIASTYIAGVERAVARLAPGATLFLLNLPQEVDCGSVVCAGPAYLFEDYSIDSWFALTRPESGVQFVAITSLAPGLDMTAPRSRWWAGEAPGSIVGEVTGAVVRRPLFSRAADYFDLSLAIDGGRRTTITVINPRVYDGTHFVYDHLQPGQLLTFTTAGLTPVTGALR